MEVTQDNFFRMLPSLLDEAQKARFVAIDLEMSGVSSSNGRVQHNISVQDAYTKIKEVAQEFQVLQIGFTFVLYDAKNSEYTTRTFNCPISPLFPKSVFSDGLTRHLDRKIGISAKSYSFLRKHNFDLNHTLNRGIYYLNRREQRLSEQFCLSRFNENELIDPVTLDHESQQFYEYARRHIEAFTAAPFEPDMKTFIRNLYGDNLNNLQIRLVHQIIREEYPTCTAKRIQAGPEAGSVRITYVDRTTETEIETWRRKNMDEAKRLSGLQILFEALSGGSFAARINREWINSSEQSATGADSRDKFNESFNFQQCEDNLKRHQPILVGHNLLLDLAFIYQTFFEPLPPLVDDFLERINTLFPRIVDTKFMDTSGKHMMEPDRPLQNLHDFYTELPFPIIREVPKLGATTAGPHNAGFDSHMTAVLLLKQTHYLFIMKKHQSTVIKESYVRARRDRQGEEENASPGSTSVASQPKMNTSSLLDQEEADTLEALQNWDTLIADESTSMHAALPTRDMDAPPAKQEEEKEESSQEGKDAIPSEIYSEEELHIIPPWVDDFWKVYGNKSALTGAGCVSFA